MGAAIFAQTMTDTAVAQQSINTIRTLCMDAVQQVNSGHPGTPMAIGASAPLKELQKKFG